MKIYKDKENRSTKLTDRSAPAWHESRALRKLQREWYAKLEDEGFYDIEGGVEGHLLKGPTSSVSLQGLANKKADDHGLKHDRAPRDFDDVADSANEDLDYANGAKARYFHMAALISAQAFREGYSAQMCYAWTLHAQGHGERQVAEMLDTSRAQIRKHIKTLRDNILPRVDSHHR